MPRIVAGWRRAILAGHIEAICGGDGVDVESKGEGWRRARYGDVALLFRSMSHVQYYEGALKARGIPYVVVAGTGFYRKQEVVDVMNVLHVLMNPYDEAAVAALLRGPFCALRDDSLLSLANSGPLVVQALSAPVPDDFAEREALLRLRALLELLQEHRNEPVATLLQLLYRESGIEAVLLSMYHGLQRVANLRKLVDLALSFSRSQQPNLRAFVVWVESLGAQAKLQEGDALLQAEGADVVTLMTIHKSKGLEFPVVALPDLGARDQSGRGGALVMHRALGLAVKSMDDNAMLHLPPMGDAIMQRKREEEGAEKARLLYVAMTRAQDYLILGTGAKVESGSWAASINECVAPQDHDHGAQIEGDGWSARVIRDLPGDDGSEDGEALEAEKAGSAINPAQLAPVSLVDAPVEEVSVSTVLDALHPSDYGDGERRVVKARLDPLVRGTLVHAMFEYWDFGGEAPVDRVIQGSGLGPAQLAQITRDLARIATDFVQSPLYSVLCGAGRLYREYPFTLRLGDMLVHGTIDAMLEDFTLIDYKTGKHNPDNEARYRSQVLLYALAVQRLTGVMPPQGHVVYVDEGVTSTVEWTRDDLEELAQRVEGVLTSPR